MKHHSIDRRYHSADCGCGRCQAAHPRAEISGAVRCVLCGGALGWLAGAALTLNHYWPAIVAAFA